MLLSESFESIKQINPVFIAGLFGGAIVPCSHQLTFAANKVDFIGDRSLLEEIECPSELQPPYPHVSYSAHGHSTAYTCYTSKKKEPRKREK